MSTQIQERRGLKANLPAAAPAGELLYCTDTNELFVGTGTGVAICETDARSMQGTKVNAQLPLNGQVYIFDSVTGTLIPGDPIVSGPDAPGVPPTRPPVQIGGFDGTNVQRVLTDSTGRVSVNVSTLPSIAIASLPSVTVTAQTADPQATRLLQEISDKLNVLIMIANSARGAYAASTEIEHAIERTLLGADFRSS